MPPYPKPELTYRRWQDAYVGAWYFFILANSCHTVETEAMRKLWKNYYTRPQLGQFILPINS